MPPSHTGPPSTFPEESASFSILLPHHLHGVVQVNHLDRTIPLIVKLILNRKSFSRVGVAELKRQQLIAVARDPAGGPNKLRSTHLYHQYLYPMPQDNRGMSH